MPPRVTTLQQAEKRRRYQSSDEDEPQENPTHPWPRLNKDYGKPIYSPHFNDHYVRDARRFAANKDHLNRPVTGKWDAHDSHFYNAWLDVKIVPSRLACPTLLEKLGIRDEVMSCLDALGLTAFVTTGYRTYPDLVRQFMASVRLVDDVLSFMAYGKRYYIRTPALGSVYGFNDSEELLRQWPIAFTDVAQLWTKIGHGKWTGKGTRQSLIRHPVLRYLAKVFSHTILCKTDTTKLRLQEMCFMHYAIGDRFPEIRTPAAVSFGHVFATHLLTLKMKPFQGGANVGKEESVGMFLTPLFLHFGIDVTTESNKLRSFNSIDEAYLNQGHFLKDRFRYAFVLPDGIFHLQLPKPSLTQIDTEDQLFFYPPRQYLTSSSTAGAASSSSAAAPPMDEIFEEVDFDTIEPLIPDSCALAPDPVYTDFEAVGRWLVEEKKKDRTMLGKILRYVSCMGRKSDAQEPSASRAGGGAHRATISDDEEEDED